MSRWIRSLSVASFVGSSVLISLNAHAASPHLLSLNSPSGLAIDGSTLWIAEQGSGSMVALNAATGAYKFTVGPSVLKISSPDALIVHAHHVYVSGVGGAVGFNGANGVEVRSAPSKSCAKANTKLANSLSGLVEMCSNGTLNLFSYTTLKLIRSATPTMTSITHATSLLVVKSTLFVTNSADAKTPDEIVEYSLPHFTKLKTLRNVSQPKLALSSPMGIGFDGTDLWVTNSANDTLTEISLAKLLFVAVISGDHSYNLWGPHDVLVSIANPVNSMPTIFVTNVDGPSSSMVTRFTSPANSSPVFGWTMCNTNDAYTFDDPSGIALYFNVLWVVNRTNGALDQMNATTGTLTHVFN